MKNFSNLNTYTVEDRSIPIQVIRNAMPKVGDHLKKVPFVELYKVKSIERIKKEPLDCIVTYVNLDHLWYEVEFVTPYGRFKESFKCPETREISLHVYEGCKQFSIKRRPKGDYFVTKRCYYNG